VKSHGYLEGVYVNGAPPGPPPPRVAPARLPWAAGLYRESARGDAELWLVPANLASLRDIDALIEWVGAEQRATIGASSTVLKPAMVPDILFPFAAPPVSGSLEEAGTAAENQARVLLWGVERLIGGLSRIGEDTHVGHRLHVVLPGSPNRGTFGGDGAYGEVKAAFDAIVNKWAVERWGRRVSIAHAIIGWGGPHGMWGGIAGAAARPGAPPRCTGRHPKGVAGAASSHSSV